MPEFVRAYIVVMGLSMLTFSLVLQLNLNFIKKSEIRLYRNYWLAITTISFFSPNVWIYAIVLVSLLIFSNIRGTDRLSLFMAILCASPLFILTIPGFGLINFLISISYANILALLLLLPAYRSTRGQFFYSKNRFDNIVVLYVSVICLLNFRENTLTNGIRESINFLITILLPYFAFSRLPTGSDALKKLLFSLFLCLIPLAVIGSFETLKHWKLYSSSISQVMDYERGIAYGLRGESLRSSALFSGPLILGYAMTVGIGLLPLIGRYCTKKTLIKFFGILLLSALYFTKARGSWVGLVALVILYLWSGRQRFSNLAKAVAGGLITIAILSVTSFGEKIISSLPFLAPENSHEASTVDYRFRLLERSWILFQKHPILGLSNYRETPELEVMRQGQGIIDVVNSYAHIGLSYG